MNYQCIRSKRNQNWKIWHHGLNSKLNHTFFDLAQPWKSYNNLFPFLESQQEMNNENCSLKCHLELSQLRGGIVNSWINCINIVLATPFTLSKIFHPNTKLDHMHKKQMPPIVKIEVTMIHFIVTMVKNEGWKLISHYKLEDVVVKWKAYSRYVSPNCPNCWLNVATRDGWTIYLWVTT
jgi:hypothetical protein